MELTTTEVYGEWLEDQYVEISELSGLAKRTHDENRRLVALRVAIGELELLPDGRFPTGDPKIDAWETAIARGETPVLE